MDGITAAVGKGADNLVATYGPPGFFILLLVAVIVYLWREIKAERKTNADLQAQINTEIKSGIAMAQDFRKTYESSVDTFRGMFDSLRGKG